MIFTLTSSYAIRFRYDLFSVEPITLTDKVAKLVYENKYFFIVVALIPLLAIVLTPLIAITTTLILLLAIKILHFSHQKNLKLATEIFNTAQKIGDPVNDLKRELTRPHFSISVDERPIDLENISSLDPFIISNMQPGIFSYFSLLMNQHGYFARDASQEIFPKINFDSKTRVITATSRVFIHLTSSIKLATCNQITLIDCVRKTIEIRWKKL